MFNSIITISSHILKIGKVFSQAKWFSKSGAMKNFVIPMLVCFIFVIFKG